MLYQNITGNLLQLKENRTEDLGKPIFYMSPFYSDAMEIRYRFIQLQK